MKISACSGNDHRLCGRRPRRLRRRQRRFGRPGGKDAKETVLSAPKEPVGQLKFNGKDVPIYEYKGEGLPDMVHTTTNLTVTKDAIYAGKFDASGDSIFRIDL